MDVLEIQLETHGETLSEEQRKNWQKILYYGRAFVEACEDNHIELAKREKQLKNERIKNAKLTLKVIELQEANNKLKRTNEELNETLAKGFRV